MNIISKKYILYLCPEYCYMSKCYNKLFVILIFILAISSCKVDAPIYPEGAVPDFTNVGGGLSNATIEYTIDGQIKRFSTGFFQVIAPTDGLPDGNTQVAGGLDPNTAFSLSASTVVAGTFDADVILIGTLLGSGKVTFTQISTDNSGLKGTVKGTFTGKVVSLTDPGIEKDVSGSFSIKM